MNPRVRLAAVQTGDAKREDRRAALDALKKSASDNALADYLSALDYFKSASLTPPCRT